MEIFMCMRMNLWVNVLRRDLILEVGVVELLGRLSDLIFGVSTTVHSSTIRRIPS